jgi:hypothetical protein
MNIPSNCIFVCLKDHMGNIIVWIVIIVFGIFYMNYKFCMLKAWQKSKMFLHVQNIQTFKVDNPCVFFNFFFFLPSGHHFSILTFMIRKAKIIELMVFIFFIAHLSTFGSKVLWPWKLWILKIRIQQKLFIYMW